MKGKMVFEEKLVIVNTQKIDSSVQIKKPLLVNLFRDMMYEIAKKENKPIDTLAINNKINSQITPSIDFVIDPRKTFNSTIEHVCIFKGSVIEYSIRENYLSNTNKLTVINRDSGKKDYFFIKDSIRIKDDTSIRIDVKENEPATIQEFRNEKKNILGYECFKIEITKNKNSLRSLEMFGIDLTPELKEKYSSLLNSSLKETYYVTEQISCIYHPSTSLKTILDKYYPLEIIAPSLWVDGAEMRFTLKEIELD